MKLTIERLTSFSAQDLLDLGKIWPGQTPDIWQQWLDEGNALFAARFNQRLLAAVKVEPEGASARLHDLMVREVTRRRGVGRYLLEETLRQMPEVNHWWLEEAGGDAVLQAFMAACGFRNVAGCWQK